MQDNQVKVAAEKQEKALKLACGSASNVFNLTLDEVEMVCESKKPQMITGVAKFVHESHEKLWEWLLISSIDEIVKDFERQISNERLVKEIIGE